MEGPRSSFCCAKMAKSNTKSGVLNRRTETACRPSKRVSECMFYVCLELGVCRPTAWRCKVPILYAYNNVVTPSTFPGTRALLRQPAPLRERSLVERAWSVSNEGAAALLHTVGERETETWSKQLLDVWATDILILLNLNNPEDLKTSNAVSRCCLLESKLLNEHGSNGSGHGA